MKLLPTLLSLVLAGSAFAADSITLNNVSYDVPRKFYEEFDRKFEADYKAKTGTEVIVKTTHGPSGKQGRSVVDGLPADVVTLALANDVINISKKGKLIDENWQSKLPENSSPYTSTIIFLVRKGNPKQIKDWNDLVKPGVAVLTPNPKTGGNPRWAYLAAWGAVLDSTKDEAHPKGDAAKAREYITALYKNVPVLDEGARASLTTFAVRNVGDVLLAWENEAHLALAEFGADKFEIVYPAVSILAEPTVAVVDVNVDKRGTRAVAEAYLKALYTPEARELQTKNFFRPRDAAELEKHKDIFPPVKLFTIDDVFGGWPAAQKEHFDEGGVFDQIYSK